MQVLSKNQKALSKRRKLRKRLKFDSGCTVWQSTPQNLLNINLTNSVSSLEEPLGKEQKVILRSPIVSFVVKGIFGKTSKSLKII